MPSNEAMDRLLAKHECRNCTRFRVDKLGELCVECTIAFRDRPRPHTTTHDMFGAEQAPDNFANNAIAILVVIAVVVAYPTIIVGKLLGII